MLARNAYPLSFAAKPANVYSVDIDATALPTALTDPTKTGRFVKQWLSNSQTLRGKLDYPIVVLDETAVEPKKKKKIFFFYNRPPTRRPNPNQGGNNVNTGSTGGNNWERRLTPCNVPAQPANGRWRLHRSLCEMNVECNAPLNVRSMEPGSYLVYSCDQGFIINGTSDVLCGPNGQWIHEPRCDGEFKFYNSMKDTDFYGFG